ncbi:MAG TPA: hypothetical protein VKV25_09410 [Acidimicrobiales bacterium]|nr:hypothetical protein [Acidimicrobiales bacterium]
MVTQLRLELDEAAAQTSAGGEALRRIGMARAGDAPRAQPRKAAARPAGRPAAPVDRRLGGTPPRRGGARLDRHTREVGLRGIEEARRALAAAVARSTAA